MKELIMYLIVFVLTYLFYFVFVLSRKNVLKKFPDGMYMMYLKKMYGVKVNDKNLKSIAKKVFLANSFILSTTVYVVCLFDNLLIEILLGIVTLTILILVLYHFIGTYYQKKQGGK